MAADVVPAGMKLCGDREHEGERALPFAEFYPSRTNRSGMQSACKACTKRRAAVRIKTTYSEGGAGIREDLEDEPEEKDDGERWWRFRMWAAYQRAGGREVGPTKATDHQVDPIVIVRWSNTVAAELRAGHSLDEALAIANRDEAFDDDEDLPIGVERQPKPKLPPVELAIVHPLRTAALVEQDDAAARDRLRGAEFDSSHGPRGLGLPLPLWQIALARREAQQVRQGRRVAESPIARSRTVGDETTPDDLALELAGVTERQVRSTATETEHLDPEARLGRKESALHPGGRRPARPIPIGQTYCALCGKWGFHKRLECPKYSGRATPSRVPGPDLELRILEALRRARLTTSGLAYELDTGVEQVACALDALVRAGRVMPMRIGQKRCWSRSEEPT